MTKKKGHYRQKSQLVFCILQAYSRSNYKVKTRLLLLPNTYKWGELFSFMNHIFNLFFLGYFAGFVCLNILQAGKQVAEARRQLSSLADLKEVS